MILRLLAPRLLRPRNHHCVLLRTLTTIIRPTIPSPSSVRLRAYKPLLSIRHLSAKSSADQKIEEITELFATAQDEFEIAMEETEKVSVYAEEDRKTAREELDKVQEAFKGVIEGGDEALAEEVKRRIGHRIRELEAGVERMEEMALNQD